MPKDSLKFFYGPDDDSDSKRGFTTVSVGTGIILQLQRYVLLVHGHYYKLIGYVPRYIDDSAIKPHTHTHTCIHMHIIVI